MSGFYENLINFLIKSSKFFFDFGFIIFPSAGFIAQYFKIKSIKNSKGFSKFISFALIMAYIFRIYFWLGKKFEITLLYQSIFGIFIQLILLEICVRYSNKEKFSEIYIKNSNFPDMPNSPKLQNVEINDNKHLHSENSQALNEFDNYRFFVFKNFWNWNLFIDYVNFLFAFFIILGIITHIFEDNEVAFFEIIGSISAFSEAIIAFPQILENFKYKSTKTLSSILILTWISGDSIKLFYFIIINAPIQMIACAVTQIIEDLIIIFQIYYYRKNILHES